MRVLRTGSSCEKKIEMRNATSPLATYRVPQKPLYRAERVCVTIGAALGPQCPTPHLGGKCIAVLAVTTVDLFPM